jgi:hypothetical protein
MGGFDYETLEDNKIQPEDWIFCELGKFKVNKVEEGQAFLKGAESEEEIPIPVINCKKFLNFNFLIVGKTQIHSFEKFEININKNISYVKDILAEYLEVPRALIQLHFKDTKFTDDQVYFLYDLQIADNETFIISFKESEEFCYARSINKDYSWSDAKNFIPFTVDKKIIVTGFGFFRHYESSPAVYDFLLYEVDKNNNNNKSLILMLSNVKVLGNEADAFMVKKVIVNPICLKENVVYHAYVIFKATDMKTYFISSGNSLSVVEGVTFKILEETEDGYRSSSTSGHMPYIYFKFDNAYEK